MEAIWNEVKKAVKETIPEHSYRMWIEPIAFEKTTADGIAVLCPNLIYQKKIEDHYAGLIESELGRLSSTACKLHVGVSARSKKYRPSISKHHQLTLPDITPGQYSGRMLRGNYTFDQFVVGENNGFAYSAALSLASKKNNQQNALFLLSKTGNGKSHLSQAVGHHILSEYPTERVCYITAEDFANEMVYAFQSNSINKFKDKYRGKCDVLLLEDVHYLTGKNRTQIELALTLDTLFDANKKIIFSSCYLPGDIPKLNDKLRSRLSCGLISAMETPDYRTRVRILKKKSLLNNFNMPSDVVDYLAGELTDNIRQLESGLIGIAAKSSLLGVKVDLDLAESVVQNIARQKETITIDTVKKIVCKYYKVTVKELMSRSRKQRIVKPRQVAIYLSRKYTDQPLQSIGKNFNRYHATALHAINSVERGLKNDAPVRKHVEFLRKKLESGNL
ncbi:MAG: chromosomal replication initiator protein DnaA [Deltaproteobacteria bacterium]|nr:chromosomal replication initiator protein DnaA [Deltaproteobacteria bacterium]MBW2176617.1 chromosomal replication initiator protein DnaA [Deltaproteobacteria bacterium]